jgi:hypothetical protein
MLSPKHSKKFSARHSIFIKNDKLNELASDMIAKAELDQLHNTMTKNESKEMLN